MVHMISILLQIVKKSCVGFAEHCGDSLTHMVLEAETLKIIYRSALRPRSPKDPNKRLVDAGGEEYHQPHSKPTKHPTPVLDGEKSVQPATPTVYIKSRHDMVQPQASLCQSSTLMTLLEGPFYYPLETMGRE